VIVPDATKETPKVDVLKTVLDKATLPLALVVLAIALALIFHRKLSKLIERTTSIEIDPMKRSGNSADGTSRRPDSPGRIGVRRGGDILERAIRRSERPRTQGTRQVRRLIEREAR
jgi:hypothetical protein